MPECENAVGNGGVESLPAASLSLFRVGALFGSVETNFLVHQRMLYARTCSSNILIIV